MASPALGPDRMRCHPLRNGLRARTPAGRPTIAPPGQPAIAPIWPDSAGPPQHPVPSDCPETPLQHATERPAITPAWRTAQGRPLYRQDIGDIASPLQSARRTGRPLAAKRWFFGFPEKHAQNAAFCIVCHIKNSLSYAYPCPADIRFRLSASVVVPDRDVSGFFCVAREVYRTNL